MDASPPIAASFVPDFVLTTIEAGRSVSRRRRYNSYAAPCRTGLTLQIPPQIIRPETMRQRGLARDASRT
jgi:hypothetical protein